MKMLLTNSAARILQERPTSGQTIMIKIDNLMSGQCFMAYQPLWVV